MFERFAAACAAAALTLAFATSNTWPQAARTIRLVVPFPPGGSTDILARLLGEQINKTNGPTVVIENRPGGGATIAYEAVARAAPDGNTLVINANSVVINPHLRKVNYDPIASFEPICHLVNSPNLIVVNSTSPYRTLKDYIEAARAKPGELTMAAVGPATTQHIGVEQFKRLANIDIIYVPYTGGAPAITALLGDHVSAALQNYTEVNEQLDAGKLRALAALTRERLPSQPSVPTAIEQGFADYEVEVWFGVLAPAKTPKPVVAELATWFKAALQVPEVKPKLANLALDPVGICLDDYAAHIRKQDDEYGRVIRAANIKGE